MAQKVILLDTSILIDFFRKKDKTKTRLFNLVNTYQGLCISAITEFEIATGTLPQQENFWQEFLLRVTVLPFDSAAVAEAQKINKDLKKRNK